MPLLLLLSPTSSGGTPLPPQPPAPPSTPPPFTPQVPVPVLPAVTQAIGNVEVALVYGQDLQIDATGDIVLNFDAPNAPNATQQRIYRLILQAAILYDTNQDPLTYPDDVFNPLRGAGLGVHVGEPVDYTLASTMKSRIMSALSSDPDIVQTPAPIVNVTDLGGGQTQIDVSVNTIYGQTVTIPSLVLGG